MGGQEVTMGRTGSDHVASRVGVASPPPDPAPSPTLRVAAGVRTTSWPPCDDPAVTSLRPSDVITLSSSCGEGEGGLNKAVMMSLPVCVCPSGADWSGLCTSIMEAGSGEGGPGRHFFLLLFISLKQEVPPPTPQSTPQPPRKSQRDPAPDPTTPPRLQHPPLPVPPPTFGSTSSFQRPPRLGLPHFL